ncbi:WXG100 family type VII secretion target [Actinokineospora guangxiensis]|uniref:WXG100 family type VII secretion target n=1 Tax=Actinokineospora guangxiensis TaxID=1490288 RepID=A0ABW0EWT1_9PSEU
MVDIDNKTDNPLVEDGTDLRNNYAQDLNPFENMGAPSADGGPGFMAGITAFEAGWAIAEGIDKGDWKLAVSGLIAGGLDVAGAALDPIAYVAGQLFSWMLEHIEPARAALHALSGNPDMVKAYAQSWTNIEQEMLAVSQEFGAAARSEAPSWTGQAATAYRDRAAEIAGICGGVAGAAHGIATLTLGMAEVVNGVRTAVRDILAAIAGSLVSWAIELAASLGTAAPLVAAQASAAIARVLSKVAQILFKLETALSAAITLLVAIRDILDGLIRQQNALRGG